VAARLEQLRVGELEVLVHVAMLKEGVDLPWLRGICLRRRVASATWFAQHVGRALRAAPGKTHALIMDPHDLCGMHSLNAEEVLGGGISERNPIQQLLLGLLEDALDADVLEGRRRGTVEDLRLPGHGVAKTMGPLERALRRVRVALETVGVVAPPKVASGSWRYRPASSKQAEMVRLKASALKRATGMPREVRVLLRVLYANLEHMTKGAAADFLDIVFQLPRAGRWPEEASALLEVGA
jgi:type I site-specific restriction endonuclease